MISTILTLNIKRDLFSECVTTFKTMLPETRKFTGNTGVTLYQGEDSTLTLVADWQSKQNYDNYMQWREERGDNLKFKRYLEQAPDLHVYDKNEVVFHAS